MPLRPVAVNRAGEFSANPSQYVPRQILIRSTFPGENGKAKIASRGGARRLTRCKEECPACLDGCEDHFRREPEASAGKRRFPRPGCTLSRCARERNAPLRVRHSPPRSCRPPCINCREPARPCVPMLSASAGPCPWDSPSGAFASPSDPATCLLHRHPDSWAGSNPSDPMGQAGWAGVLTFFLDHLRTERDTPAWFDQAALTKGGIS